jgi:exopolysaccharide biosynthesis protein PssK
VSAALVNRLRAQAIERVRSHLDPGARVALIDFPNHGNVGDSAIWLGETEILRELGTTVVYTCETEGYREEALRRALRPGDAILIHGGGNFGDDWPGYQALREQIVASFPKHRIVQLPQSINFSRPENLDRARSVFASHPDLVLLCRDEGSLELARREFPSAVSELAPDGAFALGPLPRRPPTMPVLWLSRTDRERRGDRLVPGGGSQHVVSDWLAESAGDDGWSPVYGGLRWVSRQVGARATRRRRVPRAALAAAGRLHSGLAGMRVRHGLGLLGSAQVVVTDRLHAHILCLLLGVPHVVVDTGYGKIERFVSAWTAEADGVRLARDADEARSMAAELLVETREEVAA